MNEVTYKSEVARFRQQVGQEEASARLGLYGPAVTASHEAITRRMERGALRILGLLHQGREQEAIALMQSESWCQEGKDE